MKKIKSSTQGFTLLELLVVVLIIGILASIALPQYENSVEKSKASEALIILKSLREQQAVCYLQKRDTIDCEQGTGDESDNLFTYSNVIEGEPDPDCDYDVCGPATKDFSYYLDGEYIGTNRLPFDTKYYLETTAWEGVDHRIACYNISSSKNYCKIIGFTKEEDGTWYQP